MSYTLTMHGIDLNKYNSACIKCNNAIWQSFKKIDDEHENYDDIVEYDVMMKKDTIRFACFCTILHRFIETKRIYCDGNSPDSEPKLEDFINLQK